jgi:CHAT domain-containing protein
MEMEMQNNSSRPVIVAAFANDRIDGQQYLRNLPDEMRRLRQILESASELCEAVFLPNATLTELIDTLQTYRNRVAILHYAGHANSFQLLLESDLGSAHRVQAKGLAEILGKQRGLKLVFLNGCSTEKQTTELLAAGVPSVIATTQAIDDRIATQLSVRFYKGLVSGASMACSFEESVGEARASVGGDETRLLKSLDDLEDESNPRVDSLGSVSLRQGRSIWEIGVCH